MRCVPFPLSRDPRAAKLPGLGLHTIPTNTQSLILLLLTQLVDDARQLNPVALVDVVVKGVGDELGHGVDHALVFVQIVVVRGVFAAGAAVLVVKVGAVVVGVGVVLVEGKG